MLQEALSVVPLSATLGAEIVGVDLQRGLSDAAFRHVLAAWRDHYVILFRDQQLSQKSLIDFSARFGTPERAAPQESELSSPLEWQQIMIVSNIVEHGKTVGHLGNKEAYWHTDMCYTPNRPIASILYGIEVPSSGGDTCFMDMYAVYDLLPKSLKFRIADLSIKHDACYTAVGDLRHGYNPVRDVSISPGAIHPIVRTHPVTGRAALYLGRRLNAYILGLPVAESDVLLDELWRYTETPGITWRHQWRVNDLLIWDNRCLMHRRDAFSPTSRRLMWRTQIQPSEAIFC